MAVRRLALRPPVAAALRAYPRGVVPFGLLLVALAGVVLVMDWGGLSERMPTQVPPSRFALYPLLGGVLLVVVSLARP
ncbi:MAG: hypothetical protein H0U89_11065 [Acidimicrobiia bacterium]|nr:hypothetical protein [Acidimicrobiia bacterium]